MSMPLSEHRLDRLFRAATELFIYRKTHGYEQDPSITRAHAVTEALKLEAELWKQLEKE